VSFELNGDQRAVQDLVRRVARERVAPRADEIDRTADYPQDMFDLLRELGLFTLPFPSEYGGSGSMLSACIAIEELGRVCYNTASMDAVRRNSRRRQRRTERTPPAWPGERRSARRHIDYRATERVRCGGHPDTGREGRRRLSAERIEDLVHQFPGIGLHSCRRPGQRGTFRPGHQPLHRRP
jgi:hypothetical protein